MGAILAGLRLSPSHVMLQGGTCPHSPDYVCYCKPMFCWAFCWACHHRKEEVFIRHHQWQSYHLEGGQMPQVLYWWRGMRTVRRWFASQRAKWCLALPPSLAPPKWSLACCVGMTEQHKGWGADPGVVGSQWKGWCSSILAPGSWVCDCHSLLF